MIRSKSIEHTVLFVSTKFSIVMLIRSIRTLISDLKMHRFSPWVRVGEHVCHVVIQMATMISHSLFYPVPYPCLRGKKQSTRTGNLPVPAHETVHLKVSLTIYRVRLVYGYQCLRLDHARQNWPTEVINFLTL